ncbi:unnamed protein product [Pleuronectes platessa]|uniref:Uncharacterized protein n=1 Tax=Pleuronectes platessa TaxID=8262 RepID=A0A9N7U588_PLEPL|nr:unnamed protein product [Pleuronectes platessa]
MCPVTFELCGSFVAREWKDVLEGASEMGQCGRTIFECSLWRILLLKFIVFALLILQMIQSLTRVTVPMVTRRRGPSLELSMSRISIVSLEGNRNPLILAPSL